MNTRHIFIINPAAGRHDMTSATVKNIEEVCSRHNLQYDIYITSHPGHATEIVRKAAGLHKADSKLIFYACGGDGTLNEVANGVLSVGGSCALTVYPVGTGNDYVKMFKGGRDAFLSLEDLVVGKEVSVDCIVSDCGCALNVLSVGLDAQVTMRKDRYRFIGGGILPYACSAVESVIRGIGRDYCADIDGRVFDGNYAMIYVGNGRIYGGGFEPVPDSRIDDGILDVLIVNKMSRAKAAFVVGKYKNGKYKELQDYLTYVPAKEIKIFSKDGTNMCINLDGEIVENTHISIRAEKQRIKFVIPQTSGLVD